MSTNGNGSGETKDWTENWFEEEPMGEWKPKERDYQTETLYVRTPTASLGSAQRSEQMDRTVAQVEALTERVNQQTQAINNLSYALKAEQQARLGLLAQIDGMSLWQRLRWLVGL